MTENFIDIEPIIIDIEPIKDQKEDIKYLDTQIINFKQELFNLRLKKGRGEKIQTHLIKINKKKIARLNFQKYIILKNEKTTDWYNNKQ